MILLHVVSKAALDNSILYALKENSVYENVPQKASMWLISFNLQPFPLWWCFLTGMILKSGKKSLSIFWLGANPLKNFRPSGHNDWQLQLFFTRFMHFLKNGGQQMHLSNCRHDQTKAAMQMANNLWNSLMLAVSSSLSKFEFF